MVTFIRFIFIYTYLQIYVYLIWKLYRCGVTESWSHETNTSFILTVRKISLSSYEMWYRRTYNFILGIGYGLQKKDRITF